MLRKLYEIRLKILILLVLIFLFALIRIFEKSLFYDPFIEYFKSDYTNLSLPLFDNYQLFIGLFLRYFFNTCVSITIIYVLFKDISIIKFVSILYVVFFILLILIFFGMIYFLGEEYKMALFYVRRFLIQPLFLLLFIPGFYLQASSNK